MRIVIPAEFCRTAPQHELALVIAHLLSVIICYNEPHVEWLRARGFVQ